MRKHFWPISLCGGAERTSGLPVSEQQEPRLGHAEAGAQARFQQRGNTSKRREERRLNRQGHKCVCMEETGVWEGSK